MRENTDQKKLRIWAHFIQGPLREEDIHETAFLLPKGKYEWSVMSFGLKVHYFRYHM